jgi:hypothetical protein
MISLRASVFAHSAGLTKRGLATITQVQSFHIPVVDFGKFRTANSWTEKKNTADEIVSAFKESGFVYLEGHGIPPSTFFLHRTELQINFPQRYRKHRF